MAKKEIEELVGYATRCVCCNRIMSGVECTRLFHNTKELIATCNSCLQEAKTAQYEHEYTGGNTVEGITPSRFPDSHSSWWYDYHDN